MHGQFWPPSSPLGHLYVAVVVFTFNKCCCLHDAVFASNKCYPRPRSVWTVECTHVLSVGRSVCVLSNLAAPVTFGQFCNVNTERGGERERSRSRRGAAGLAKHVRHRGMLHCGGWLAAFELGAQTTACLLPGARARADARRASLATMLRNCLEESLGQRCDHLT